MAAAAAAPNPNGLGMCCKKAAAVAGSLKLGRVPPEVGGRGGDVTEEGVFEAEGVSKELTLKSDDGLGDVNTVVVVEVDAVVEFVMEFGVVGLGGGVFGGVEGELFPPAFAIVDEETSSMSTDLCSWSLIWIPTFNFIFRSDLKLTSFEIGNPK